MKMQEIWLPTVHSKLLMKIIEEEITLSMNRCESCHKQMCTPRCSEVWKVLCDVMKWSKLEYFIGDDDEWTLRMLAHIHA